MLRYRGLKKKPAVFRSFTGLQLKAFEELLSAFHLFYEDDLEVQDSKRKQKRQRERGGGRQGALKTMEDKLIFILFYFKFYPCRKCRGVFWHEANVSMCWIHRLAPILNRVLGYERQLPAGKNRDVEQIMGSYPGTVDHH